MSKTRREPDRLGEVQVESQTYYCAQTVRAIRNFLVLRFSINYFSQLIQAMAILENAAAVLANARLSDSEDSAIAAACDAIVAGEPITGSRLQISNAARERSRT